MTLYARIALLLVSFVAASVLAVSWYFYQARVADFIKHHDEEALTLTAAIAKSVFADTLEGRSTKVRDTLRAIAKTNREIRYILLFGFDGEVFTSTYPDEPPPELRAVMTVPKSGRHRQLRVDGVDVLDFSHPLIENLEAHLHVGYDATGFSSATRHMRDNTLWLALSVVALALLAASLVARRISRPLKQLADALRSYGQGNPLTTFQSNGTGPEIRVLVDSFAVMAARRDQAEHDLRIAAAAFDAQESILITDADTRIVRVNQAFIRQTGYAASEVIGQRPLMLRSGRHDAAFYGQMWETLLSDGFWSGEIWNRRRDGEVFPQWLTITAVCDRMGKATHYVANYVDITEQKQAEARIQRLAYHDTLTGLPNRFSLHERMEQVLALARRDRRRFALMLIDLDRFKQINDTLGHHVGDQLLVQVAHRLLDSVRDSDIVARLGGDEFVVVQNALETPDAATRLAEKIVAQLSAPFQIAGNDLSTSPSIGICLFPDDAETLEDLIQQADVAMYQAKAQGRGRHLHFTPQMQVAVHGRVAAERELRTALTAQQFVLHYQPQLDLRSGRLYGVEALIRWQHPQRGLVAPADFISIAEETGLIDGIGDWVITAACRQLQQWRGAGLTEVSMSINLSAGQFTDAMLSRRLREAAAEFGIPHAAIVLEVTETMAMATPDETINVLRTLRQEGFALSIDDFGTGYSSLAYLKLFPFNTLKIDRSFVRDIETDPDDAGICDVTVLLAHKLGRDTVAEGVETAGQLKFLLSIGCEKVQGFLISKPLPADAAEGFLRNHPGIEGNGTIEMWLG